MRIALMSLVCLAACSKTAEPGKLADFVGKPGALAAACVPANDGKRHVVDGYVGPSGDVTVRDGKVDLYVHESFKDGEGDGPGFVIEAKDGSQVSFAVSNEQANFHGGSMGSKGTLEGVILHTAAGDATPADKLGVVFDTEVIKHFQSGEVTGCVFRLVELRKP